MCPEHKPRVLLYDTATGVLKAQWATGNPSSVAAVQALEVGCDLVRAPPAQLGMLRCPLLRATQ
jgi:hypothetical protein